MRILLTKLENIVLTIITIPRLSPLLSVMVSPLLSDMVSTSGRLHSEFVLLLFLQDHRETDRFFSTSRVQVVQSTSDQFHYRRTTFSSQFKSKITNILVKSDALLLVKDATLRINLNIDVVHRLLNHTLTHHTLGETSRLLTSSLSLGVPVPHST
jgi:hypothetical protein